MSEREHRRSDRQSAESGSTNVTGHRRDAAHHGKAAAPLVTRLAFGDEEGSVVVGESEKSREARAHLRRINDETRDIHLRALQRLLTSSALHAAKEAIGEEAGAIASSAAVKGIEAAGKGVTRRIGEKALSAFESTVAPAVLTYEIGEMLEGVAGRNQAERRAALVAAQAARWQEDILSQHRQIAAAINDVSPEQAIAYARPLPQPEVTEASVYDAYEQRLLSAIATGGVMSARESVDRVEAAVKRGRFEEGR
jgi:hypothetical protein